MTVPWPMALALALSMAGNVALLYRWEQATELRGALPAPPMTLGPVPMLAATTGLGPADPRPVVAMDIYVERLARIRKRCESAGPYWAPPTLHLAALGESDGRPGGVHAECWSTKEDVGGALVMGDFLWSTWVAREP